MNVCIFGPNGYVGVALQEALRARGDRVQLVSSRSGGMDPDTGLVAPSTVVEPGTEVVYYLSQSPHYRRVPDAAPHLLAVNCVSAVRAAGLAAAAGARRLVYASTGNVYAPAFAPVSEDAPVRRDSWYPLSKLMGEEALALCRDRIDVTVLRIFGIYGPGQTDKLVPMLVKSVREGRPVTAERNPRDPQDHGGLRFSPLYIDDAVAILLQLAQGPSAPVLNLAGPEVVSVADIATAAARKLGLHAEVRLADKARQTDLIGDPELLRRLLAPRFTPFAQGLDRVLEAGV